MTAEFSLSLAAYIKLAFSSMIPLILSDLSRHRGTPEEDLEVLALTIRL